MKNRYILYTLYIYIGQAYTRNLIVIALVWSTLKGFTSTIFLPAAPRISLCIILLWIQKYWRYDWKLQIQIYSVLCTCFGEKFSTLWILLKMNGTTNYYKLQCPYIILEGRVLFANRYSHSAKKTIIYRLLTFRWVTRSVSIGSL